ncbi:hypothetical protein [Paraburkholderia sp. CI3]|uniref:hypothetical protein n=1 Tax=Paraburkholderia sp. CI3 TaxID=2991060 RepID=UPI003D2559D2
MTQRASLAAVCWQNAKRENAKIRKFCTASRRADRLRHRSADPHLRELTMMRRSCAALSSAVRDFFAATLPAGGS